MSGFDAIAHAMTTIATGGFSTHSNSFGNFNSASIEWISIIFMIIGSLPFVIYLKMIHGEWKSFFKERPPIWSCYNEKGFPTLFRSIIFICKSSIKRCLVQ